MTGRCWTQRRKTTKPKANAAPSTAHQVARRRFGPSSSSRTRLRGGFGVIACSGAATLVVIGGSLFLGLAGDATRRGRAVSGDPSHQVLVLLRLGGPFVERRLVFDDDRCTHRRVPEPAELGADER